MNNKYMEIAIKEAEKCYKIDDVPVGVVIVENDKIIAKAHNMRQKKKDITKHAEIIALSKACRKKKTYHLNECEMYVTLEPCMMCSGAIDQAHISKIYYSISNEKYGYINNICGKVKKYKGLNSEKSLELLKNFFKDKR